MSVFLQQIAFAVGGEEMHVGLIGSRPAWAALEKTEDEGGYQWCAIN